jgi:hypothetical protein
VRSGARLGGRHGRFDSAMGHVVVAQPGVDRYQLHARLLRALRERGHRATVLCLERPSCTFWRAQGEQPATLPARGDGEGALPVADVVPAVGALRRRLLRARSERIAAWLDGARPDLLLLHGDRGTDAALLQNAARRAGIRVLWTGDGLLPHTMQVDERGLDGDASCAQRAALDFRVVRGEPQLLAACLAAALARTAPFAMPPLPVLAPPLAVRLADALRACGNGDPAGAWTALRGWRRAHAPCERPAMRCTLPAAPFVAVLLQRPDDPRVRLDGGAAAPATLVDFARSAASALGGDVGVVAVAPDEVPAGTFRGVPLLPASAASVVAATALATITCNHPIASVALLAGTPVLHTGRAPYAVRGVATPCTPEQLPAALPRAIARDHPTLRERFLTWLFVHGHVWCSPTAPDHNGLSGLVQAVEARLAPAGGTGAPLRYRAGPPWPLAAERPRTLRQRRQRRRD